MRKNVFAVGVLLLPLFQCNKLAHHLRMTPPARDAGSAFADRQFRSDCIFHTFLHVLPNAGHLFLSRSCKPPQYLHCRPSLDCLPRPVLPFLGLSGCFCTGILLETSIFTKFTGSCAPSLCIFFSCSLVASLIRNDSVDVFRLQPFSLNNLVLAALSLQPSSSQSRTFFVFESTKFAWLGELA